AHEPSAYEHGAYEHGAYEHGAYEASTYEPGAYNPGSYGPGTQDGDDTGGFDTGSFDTGSFKGLPRRVRQASLAPGLRTSPDSGGTTVPPASAPDPVDVKNTLSAMQRGWQQGRAQSRRDSEGNDDI
ncbi:MAG: hypothetical protein J2P26_13555, partial [Nocardiopsaceae bacterium]|nr:hypothetical protein [Nocardiopsaceae bacterium]